MYATRSLHRRSPAWVSSVGVVGGVVGRHDDGGRVEALHEQPALLVDGWIHGAQQARHPEAAGPRPRTASSKSRLTAGSFTDSKNPKKAVVSRWRALWWSSTMPATLPTSQPVPGGHPQRHARVGEERIVRTEHLAAVAQERRDPVRIVPIDRVGNAEEPAEARPLAGQRYEAELAGHAGRLRDDAEFPPDPRAGLERPRQLSLGVRGHAARSEEGAAGRGGRGDHRVDEDALLVEPSRHGERPVVVPHDDRE